MKFSRIINFIFIKFKIDNRVLAFIINNFNNNDIFFRDLIKYLFIIEFNNLFNLKKKSLCNLYNISYI